MNTTDERPIFISAAHCLIQIAHDSNADNLAMKVRGVTCRGEMIGDWDVIVRKRRPGLLTRARDLLASIGGWRREQLKAKFHNDRMTEMSLVDADGQDKTHELLADEEDEGP